MEMTMIDTGTYGAKVQSWRAKNPRDLLMKLLNENPGVDKAQALALLWENLQTKRGKEYLFTIVEYWNSNNYDSLVKPIRGRTRGAPQPRG